MDGLICRRYNKSTKVIEATFPRANQDSTQVPHKDKLSLVYDVYTQISSNGEVCHPRVNLLFLHGSGMNRTIWEYYVAHLEDYELNWQINKIVLLDQVTHGDSAVLNEGKLGVNFDWSDGARDACKVAQVEFDEGFPAHNVVIGHSMGGFQAMCCGILMPNLFQLILTIEPVALMSNMVNVNDRTVLPPKFYQALYSKMADTFGSLKEYEDFISNRSFFKAVHPEILQRLIEFERRDMPDGTIRTKMNREQNIMCYMTIFPTSTWLLNSLKFIKVPVVSLIGEIAKWGPKENQDTLKKLIPNYTQDVVPGGDHLMNIEKPDENLRRLTSHISRFVASRKLCGVKDLSIDERRQNFENEFRKFRDCRVEDGPMVLAKF